MILRVELFQLAVAAALVVRFGVFAAVLPFLDHRSVPVLWRLALAVVAAVAVTPVVMSFTPQPPSLGWGKAASGNAGSIPL